MQHTGRRLEPKKINFIRKNINNIGFNTGLQHLRLRMYWYNI
jgi:hypothetical protein